MSPAFRRAFFGVITLLVVCLLYAYWTTFTEARNVRSFSDTISSSRPLEYANHTFRFTLQSDIAAGGYVDLAFPSGFSIRSTSTFAERNVEMLVNGTPRTASDTLSATLDQVIITTGAAGSIRYNINTSTGLSSGDEVVFRVGNHTSNSLDYSQSYSTTTGTTTTAADVPGVQNASTTGQHKIQLTTSGASDPTYAGFVIYLLQPVAVDPVDTTEEDPPLRFNGAPTGTIGGTTLSVEISLETNELAICKYSTTAGTAYSSMTNTFDNTGFLTHSEIVSVVNDTTYNFYVRCIDDEGNFNIDDYVITFVVPEAPSGTPNGEGDNEGDGSGTGDDGTNTDGSNSDGTNSQPGPGTGDDGSTSNSGSGGGGGGGGSGGGSGSDDPGGSADGTYPSGNATVIINGYAFPGSEVVALVDGTIAERDTADSSGKFTITIDSIARGSYTFGVYAIDDNEVKSSTFSTTFSVAGGRTSTLSNINVMPSVSVEPDPAEANLTVTVSGYSLPNAEITIENQNDKSSASLKTFTTTSNSAGAWSIEISTDGFSNGTYKVRAKAEQTSGGIETNFSDYTYYGVGQEADVGINADLNRDGSVNLTDFSILLFWWGGDGGNSDPPADINRDGSVSLTDFSIMLFNWTG